jgi:WD40 repeat protein
MLKWLCSFCARYNHIFLNRILSQVRVWDVTCGSASLVMSHDNAVCCCCWGPAVTDSSSPSLGCSRTIASGDQDSFIIVWNADTGRCSLRSYHMVLHLCCKLHSFHLILQASHCHGSALASLQSFRLCTYLLAPFLQVEVVTAASKCGTQSLVWVWQRLRKRTRTVSGAWRATALAGYL